MTYGRAVGPVKIGMIVSNPSSLSYEPFVRARLLTVSRPKAAAD